MKLFVFCVFLALLSTHASSQELCTDCHLDLSKIRVPEGFSGDLNELAEEAYAPTDLEKAEYLAAHPAERIETTEEPFGVPQFGMRPGDELIGGFGRDEGELQENVEMDEGVLTADQPEEVVPVSRTHEVEVKGLAERQVKLEAAVPKLQEAKKRVEEDEQLKKLLTEESDKQLKELQLTTDEKLKQARESFEATSAELRASSLDRIANVAEESKRVSQRKQTADENKVSQIKVEMDNKVAAARKALEAQRLATATAEKRADQLYAKDHDKSAQPPAPTGSGRGFRDRLSAITTELKATEGHIAEEEHKVSDLTNRRLTEEHATQALESRLRNLKIREDAIVAREEQLEKESERLHHAVEGDEDALESAQKEADKNTDESKNEESRADREASEAAQDEIKRLKEELARAEKREAREEEQLLAQTTSTRDASAEATQIEQQVRDTVARTTTVSESAMETAHEQAAEIIEKARNDVPRVTEEARMEVEEENKSKRLKQQALGDKVQARIESAKKAAKEQAKQEREKEETLKRQKEAEQAELLATEKTQLRETLEEASRQRLADFEKDLAAKMEDVSADLVMAQIHTSKDDTQLETLRHENDELRRAVEAARKDLKQQQDEWAFQKAVADQNPTFPTFDDEQ